MTERQLFEVMVRPYFAPLIAPATRDRLTELLAAAELVPIVERIAAFRDPTDDKFLEFAVNGDADLIVSDATDATSSTPTNAHISFSKFNPTLAVNAPAPVVASTSSSFLEASSGTSAASTVPDDLDVPAAVTATSDASTTSASTTPMAPVASTTSSIPSATTTSLASSAASTITSSTTASTANDNTASSTSATSTAQ
jgi:hypothetical protein